MTLTLRGTLQGKKKNKKKSPICISICSSANYPCIYLKRAEAGVKLIPVYTLINECISKIADGQALNNYSLNKHIFR